MLFLLGDQAAHVSKESLELMRPRSASFLFFSASFLLLSNVVWAQTAAQQLDDRLAAQQTWRAQFVQTIKDSRGVILQQTNGNIAIQRPGKFYWQVDKPTPQTVIADGKNVWIYDKDLAQVTVKPLVQGIGATPALLLTGSGAMLSQVYVIKRLSTPRNGAVFELQPRDPNSMFHQIDVGFHGKQLVSMQLIDTLDQSTTMQFHDIKNNPRLPRNLFVFTPPKGVDVFGHPQQ